MNGHPNHAPATENLQRYLRQLSFVEKSIPAPPVDGIFEERTADALREFQRLRGFTVTGNADRETWEKLYADYRMSLAQNSPPRQISLFPFAPHGFAYETNSSGFPIAAIQYMLRELQRNYAEFADLPVTGIYDKKTADAVQLFQSRNRLEPHAKTDLLTWNTIADQYNTLAARIGNE